MLSVLQHFVDLQNFRDLLLVDALRFVYPNNYQQFVSNTSKYQGWKMYWTTAPLVPENFLRTQKIFRIQLQRKKRVIKQMLTKVK
jgi:hypothetical protein